VVVLNLHDDDIQNRAGETLVQCTDPCGRSKHVHTVGSLLLVQRQQSFRCVGSRVSGLARAVMRQRGGPARRRLRSRGRRPAAAQGGGRYFIHRPPLDPWSPFDRWTRGEPAPGPASGPSVVCNVLCWDARRLAPSR